MHHVPGKRTWHSRGQRFDPAYLHQKPTIWSAFFFALRGFQANKQQRFGPADLPPRPTERLVFFVVWRFWESFRQTNNSGSVPLICHQIVLIINSIYSAVQIRPLHPGSPVHFVLKSSWIRMIFISPISFRWLRLPNMGSPLPNMVRSSSRSDISPFNAVTPVQARCGSPAWYGTQVVQEDSLQNCYSLIGGRVPPMIQMWLPGGQSLATAWRSESSIFAKAKMQIDPPGPPNETGRPPYRSRPTQISYHTCFPLSILSFSNFFRPFLWNIPSWKIPFPALLWSYKKGVSPIVRNKLPQKQIYRK